MVRVECIWECGSGGSLGRHLLLPQLKAPREVLGAREGRAVKGSFGVWTKSMHRRLRLWSTAGRDGHNWEEHRGQKVELKKKKKA